MGDLCSNPHWLSLSGKIISFNCTGTTVTDDGETTELVFRSFTYDREHNAWVGGCDGATVISRKTPARVVRCGRAADVRSGLATACVLVNKKSPTRSSFHYILFTLNHSNRLDPCVDFKLPYEMQEPVSILRGPTVLWIHEDSVFYSSLQTGGVRQIPLQSSHTLIAQAPLHKAQICILGMQKSTDQQTPIQTLGYMLEDGQVFDGAVVLPHPYTSITQCILVLSVHHSDSGLKWAVVAATSHQQLVYFENTAVKDTCALPFERPENIQVAHTGRNGSLYAISFRQGHVCTIWKETFQIASCWSGVSSIHVDDFLGCGTDQMLLFFTSQSDAGRSTDKFLITDLCGIAFSRGRDAEAEKRPAPPPENYLLTLQALQSRLQSGMIVLQELQEELRVKERVLRQALQSLTDMGSDTETVVTQHQQEGLVALWESDDESKDEAMDDTMQDTPAVSSRPQVDKLWHRLTADQLVVGVTLSADSSQLMTNLSLSILTEKSGNATPAVIHSKSQVFHLPTPCLPSSSSSVVLTFPEPAAKRSRRHAASRPSDLNTCRLAVTAATELTPLLNSACVKCSVILHYTRRQDPLAIVSSSAPAGLFCGQLDVDIHSDFQTQLLKTPELKTDEVREDLLSLLSMLERWVFHIHSPENSLGDINSWILKRPGCKKIEVSPQYLLSNSSGPSAVMVLCWHQVTPFQGELSIYSSKLQMLQFLDRLLAYLPASCVIQPVKGVGDPGTARMFALALEKELVSLREGVAATLCQEDGEEANRPQETPETSTAEGLQRCREAWQQHMEGSKSRLSPLVDIRRYRSLIQSMSKVQAEGDLAALLDNQTSPLS